LKGAHVLKLQAGVEVKEEKGRVLMLVPPEDMLDKALGRDFPEGNHNCSGACETSKDLSW